MRTWMKYLVIGWSIVSVGIAALCLPVMKTHFIKEDYRVIMALKTPEKFGDLERIGEDLFYDSKNGINDVSISKQEFVERMKKVKGVTIESKTTVDSIIYKLLPIYTFFLWCIPITVFLLVFDIFDRMKKALMKKEPGK
jgi:hypothetical protein